MQTGRTFAAQLTCKAWLALAQEPSCLAVAEVAGEVGLCPVMGWVGALQAQATVVTGLCHTLIHILLTVLPGVTCHETPLSASRTTSLELSSHCGCLKGEHKTPKSAVHLAGSPQAPYFLHYVKYFQYYVKIINLQESITS